MLQAALAFIPLLAGYIFVNTWHHTHYLILREDSQKVYFRAAFWGGIILALSFSINALTHPHLNNIIEFASSSHTLNKIASTDSNKENLVYWTIILSTTAIIGTTAGFILNIAYALMKVFSINGLAMLVNIHTKNNWKNITGEIYNLSRHDAAKRAIAALDSDLEIILLRAFEEGMVISITLGHGKVYIGFVTGSIEPSKKREMLRILPVLSGHRNNPDMSITFTTSYQEVYEKINQGHITSELKTSHFEIALPVQEIKSINLFDIEAYNAFNTPRTSKIPSPPTPTPTPTPATATATATA